MKLLKQVLADIKPTKEEEKEVEERTREFISKLNKALKDGKAVLGGSGAKGLGWQGSMMLMCLCSLITRNTRIKVINYQMF